VRCPAATTVTMPYGMSTAVRTRPLPISVRCITNASARPSTNSMDTETAVIANVTASAVHQYRSVKIVW
jgi:hypothetical protein